MDDWARWGESALRDKIQLQGVSYQIRKMLVAKLTDLDRSSLPIQ